MASTQRRVQVLAPEVARKIAAGEVIERPASVVRELLDNAIDAGAASLELQITNGGIDSVRLVDDGWGISPEDLPTCILPHATSKISSAEDLEHVASLGFRGEALASIAAVARLEITSRTPENDTAYRLTVEAGKTKQPQPAAAQPGTTVVVNSLFYCVPARKKFLKNPRAESAAVRATLTERATAFPELQFRFFVDGSLRAFYPPASASERIATLFGGALPANQLHEIRGSGPGFEITTVLAGPEHYRRDRKQIQVFVNRRRIAEFAFVQAVEHAFAPFMPGGRFPIACVFIECEPELVDFNVHPAKKEVRFRTKAEIRRRLVEIIREFLHAYDLSRHDLRAVRRAELATSADDSEASSTNLFAGDDEQGLSAGERVALIHRSRAPIVPDIPPSPAAATGHRRAQASETHPGRPGSETYGAGPPADAEFRYLGQVYGVFLLVEYRGRLFVLDQHAAHERVLYERYRAHRHRQQLLVPIEIEADETQERHLSASQAAWAELGLTLTQMAPGRWRIEAVPAACRDEEQLLSEAVLEAAPHTESLSDRFYTELACKAAVRDGDPLEPEAAVQLISEALRLPQQRCPHGRPLWIEISREELYRRAQRL